MLVEKNFLTLLYLGSKQRHANDKRVANAHKTGLTNAARNLSGYNRNRSTRSTKNMIAMLLGYGNRASRLARPAVHIAMNVTLPNGKKAVRLKMRRHVH